MALMVVAGVVGGVLYKQEITDLARKVFSGQGKTQDAKKNERGIIYDQNFKELSLSLDRVSVYVRPRELGDIHGSAEQLATVLGMHEQELLGRLEKDAQRIWLAKNISLEEEKAVTDLHLPGVFLDREQVRYYPYKGVAAHVIGFADQNMGLAGVEHYYNRLLNQASISQDEFPHIDLVGHARTGISGQHLALTIDLKIQDFLEKYVAALGAVHEGAEIAALLMETETGAIVANANFPSFDPNIFYQYKKKDLVNIMLEPVVIPLEIRGFFQDAALLQADWDRYEQSYPWSISAGVADTGSELRLWKRLGLNAMPDLDFSVQNGRGDIAGPEKKPVISGNETGTMPVEATPIQILLGMNYLLNGSHQVLPHVLDRVLERNGEREYSFRPPISAPQESHPASAEIWRLFKAKGHKEVLDSVFVDARELSFQPVEAGHGDPSVVRPAGSALGVRARDGESMTSGGEYLRNRMMFALLPAEKPELILMVMVRQPYLEPSLASAKDILDLVGPAGKILPSMVALQQVHKNLSDMMSMSERKESNYQQEQEKKTLAGLETMLELHPPLMPDLVGMSLRRALRLLQDKKVKIRIQGTGRVVAQSPSAGIPLDGVKECLLTLKKDEKTDKTVLTKNQLVIDGKIKNKVEGKK
jgi:cell division protein FtsI (penicillin-binding protein 3)